MFDCGVEGGLFDRAALAARASGYITTTGLDGGALPEGADRNR